MGIRLHRSHRRQLARAIARLPPIEREILYLSAALRLSNNAIAQQLGLSIATVERHLASAIGTLDHALDRPRIGCWHFW